MSEKIESGLLSNEQTVMVPVKVTLHPQTPGRHVFPSFWSSYAKVGEGQGTVINEIGVSEFQPSVFYLFGKRGSSDHALLATVHLDGVAFDALLGLPEFAVEEDESGT